MYLGNGPFVGPSTSLDSDNSNQPILAYVNLVLSGRVAA